MQAQINIPADAAIDPSEFTLSFTRGGNPIRYYDDGIGTLWIMRDTMGIVGIVRAQSMQDAYDIVSDEFRLPIAQEDVPDAYGAFDKLHAALVARGHADTPQLRGKCSRLAPLYFRLCTYDANSRGAWDNWELQEGYEYQSNATGTGIVAIDLNGEALDPLTPALAAHLNITIHISLDE